MSPRATFFDCLCDGTSEKPLAAFALTQSQFGARFSCLCANEISTQLCLQEHLQWIVIYAIY